VAVKPEGGNLQGIFRYENLMGGKALPKRGVTILSWSERKGLVDQTWNECFKHTNENSNQETRNLSGKEKDKQMWHRWGVGKVPPASNGFKRLFSANFRGRSRGERPQLEGKRMSLRLRG